jgi:hypothetical protein
MKNLKMLTACALTAMLSLPALSQAEEWQPLLRCGEPRVGENNGHFLVRQEIGGDKIQARATKTDLAGTYDSDWQTVIDQQGFGYDSEDLKLRVTIIDGKLLEGFFHDSVTGGKIGLGNHLPCRTVKQ